MACEAKARGLDVIALTDHVDPCTGSAVMAGWPRHFLEYEQAGARSDVRVIPGVELATRDGHLLGLFPSYRPSPSLMSAKIYRRSVTVDDAVERIHAAGGVAVAAHVFRGDGLGAKIVDYVPILDGAEWVPPRPHAPAVAEHARVGATAGSDAHSRIAIGASFTLFPRGALGDGSLDDYLACIRNRQTRVGAPSKGSVVKALDATRWMTPRYALKIVSMKVLRGS
jgi:hypothetical protein